MSRRDDVAFHFRGRFLFGHAGIFHHVFDGFLMLPAFVVNAGVNYQPCGPHHVVAQSAQLVQRIGGQAHFGSQPLRIQSPTFLVCRKTDHAAEKRHTLHLLRQRYLEMVARHDFVEDRAAHAELRRVFQRAQVRIEHAGPRAIHCTWYVIGAGRGCGRFDGGRTHFDRSLGARSKCVGQLFVGFLHDGAIFGQHFLAAFVGIGIAVLRIALQLLHALADAPLLQPDLAQQPVHDAGDAVDIGQPQFMHALRGQVGRGVIAHAPGVIFVAVRQRPGAIVGVRTSLQVDEMADQSGIGRIHALLDCVSHALQQFIAHLLTHVGQRNRVKLGLEAGVQHVLARRSAGEAMHLQQHFLDQELRRQDTGGLLCAQALDQLFELAREFLQAGDIAFRFAAVADAMYVVHEFRQRALQAVHLVDRKFMQLEALAFHHGAQIIMQRVVGQLRLASQLVAVIAIEHGQVVLHVLEDLVPAPGRFVVQP
ncbi:hypothetical protein ASD07_13115 [Duganella sp. Root336D2]|nr:hypothetical protein ASD07_13115 [Duganella sp. Root336D2]